MFLAKQFLCTVFFIRKLYLHLLSTNWIFKEQVKGFGELLTLCTWIKTSCLTMKWEFKSQDIRLRKLNIRNLYYTRRYSCCTKAVWYKAMMLKWKNLFFYSNLICFQHILLLALHTLFGVPITLCLLNLWFLKLCKAGICFSDNFLIQC